MRPSSQQHRTRKKIKQQRKSPTLASRARHHLHRHHDTGSPKHHDAPDSPWQQQCRIIQRIRRIRNHRQQSLPLIRGKKNIVLLRLWEQSSQKPLSRNSKKPKLLSSRPPLAQHRVLTTTTIVARRKRLWNGPWSLRDLVPVRMTMTWTSLVAQVQSMLQLKWTISVPRIHYPWVLLPRYGLCMARERTKRETIMSRQSRNDAKVWTSAFEKQTVTVCLTSIITLFHQLQCRLTRPQSRRAHQPFPKQALYETRMIAQSHLRCGSNAP